MRKHLKATVTNSTWFMTGLVMAVAIINPQQLPTNTLIQDAAYKQLNSEFKQQAPKRLS